VSAMLTKEPRAYQWQLPESLEIPPDELEARLDFYHNSVMLYLMGDGLITTKMVSAREVALAFLRNTPLRSGILPNGALWWGQGRYGMEIALWQPPKVWPVALQIKAFEPPRRFKLPMPGLIFVCSPGRPPSVYASKRRPAGPDTVIYHAPLFNVYQDGSTCPGTHKYPDKVEEIPGSFFISFFTIEASFQKRSKKHPDSLFRLWEELDGMKKYPLTDLEAFGKLEDIMK